MDERTREYLRGRFGDYYRRSGIEGPPAANEREWGHIPFTAGSGTTMVRHQSWLDVAGGGSLVDFLAREQPRHVYHSAGRYRDPGASRMSEKGWRAADLVFDLDADHLPGVDPEATSYADMLRECKNALLDLLDFLEGDFGFEDLDVVFSGGRGYHVHVRDEGVLELGRDQRDEIVEYVRGPDIEFADVVDTEAVAGMGLKNPAQKRTLPTDGGWGARVHRRLMDLVDEIRDLPEEEALERLREFPRVGEGKAGAIRRAASDNYDELAAGNLDVHPAVVSVAKILFERALDEDGAPIDEPVTTDINRLIRLPGSLHGGSGLVVTPIERDALDDFDPLADAIPEQFRGHEIRVAVTDPGPTEFDGDTFTVAEGERSVQEALGVFLMARGRARKVAE
ncbi:DNA primase small subunit PriS [Halosegnis marinus]|uniref:DNA primase small subunit PriS n=1 Tax=Halosegnis marinus TaxID=3034023 RepID=A0ABD5ZK71_9EURY|nr:DNA primase small subunit PriS [Halosegnis sp. DT85]